ncbi:acyl-CoA dehydrogenase family protein (plasmid) [Paracoccus methylovorus]|uniref:Acyl-[acyl-carrier-protein] dehydrogenase MbtN n=2 Tax=Paracoccus methylovorus TaxID=2812658 RepID=A0ABX7JP09_9RHOB|nr:acyl-CoA dehydrogenase family protein [Paracoccus methylovorus]
MQANRPRRAWESDEAAMFRASLRAFLETEAVPREEAWREQRFVEREFWHKAGELGALCPSIPVEYGGSGGDFTFEAVMVEELGYCGITSFQQNIHGTIVAHYIHQYGSDAQKAAWLPKLATGEWIAAIGMTEPGAGSDLKALRTSARREGDSYVVNGSKIFITNGMLADLLIVACKTDPARGAKGISLLVLETEGAQGFSRGRNLHKIGMHGSDTAELFFEDVRIPAANLLGAENDGFVQMMTQLPQERMGVAIGAQAMAEHAVELTQSYMREREAFGGRLLDLQVPRHMLVDCLRETRVSRAFVDDCITRHNNGELSAADASMAKLHTTEMLGRVMDICVQLHGGYGYMEEYRIARMYADARVQRIYAGASEIMKDIIARTL